MAIKTRLIITISIIVALAMATIGIATIAITRDRMIARVDETLLAAPILGGRFDDGPGPGGRFGAGRRATAIILYSANGEIIAYEPSGFEGNPDPLPALSATDLDENVNRIITRRAADGSRQRFRVLIRQIGGRYVAVAAPLDDVAATTRNLIIVVVTTGGLVLVAVVLAVRAAVTRGLRPIDDMIATAGLIAEGDLSHRIEHADDTTEVGQLGAALNEMLAQIEASFAAREASEQRLRQFVADASHELRTPLTSIRGYAELFRSGAAESPETLARVMARIELEGARMGKLVDDLLLLARLDQGRPLERRPVDLRQIAEESVMAAHAIEPDRPISLSADGGATVTGDPDRLRQVIDNLLTNARVHIEPGTAIRVHITSTDERATVVVEDDGPGIAPEDQPHVFDRFYRADPSRQRASGGTGLGLSIVAAIVAAHGGRVDLASAPGKGTTVTLTLPRENRAE